MLCTLAAGIMPDCSLHLTFDAFLVVYESLTYTGDFSPDAIPVFSVGLTC